MLEPIEKNAVVNDTRITYFERGLSFRGQKPSLVFVHATGFHGRVWDKIINAVGDYHSISIEQRGHGRSEKKKINHWDEVITDVRELIEQLDLNNIIAVGHSMGAHALIGAAPAIEERFSRMVAIDPVIPKESDFHEPSIFSETDEHPTAKRRNEFESPEDMADRLRTKGSFGLFDPDMFLDYCRHGLVPNPRGKGFILACPPEVEASVYMSSRSNHGIYEAVRAINIPILILRAKEPKPDRDMMDFSSSPTWPGLVNEFRNGRELYFSDKSHFLPMEIPDQVIAILQDEIALSS